MKSIRYIISALLLLVSTTVSAQYTQNNPKVEYMLKVEAGYLHFINNYGEPDKIPSSADIQGTGFPLNAWEEAAGLNVINGINISQDFFLGLGLGYNYCAPMRPMNLSKSSNLLQGFIDMDYRPIGTTWAPMVGARLGGSFLMNPNNYGNTIGPYIELYGGLNWFYDHALQQMDKNYHSIFVEVGVIFVQQTVFLPIRIGWRL